MRRSKRETLLLSNLVGLSIVEVGMSTLIVRTCAMPGCFAVKVSSNAPLSFFGLMTMSLYSSGVTTCCKALLARQRLFLSSFEVTCDDVSQVVTNTSQVSTLTYSTIESCSSLGMLPSPAMMDCVICGG